MITPRRVRLIRAADLAGYRSALADRVRDLAAATAADTFVLVPTSAAAEQLRRTFEDRLLRQAGQRLLWPAIGSRSDLYALLIDRLPARPRLLSGFEREALLAAGARAAEELGAPPPFHVRPALVAEMIALYDHIRRLGRTTDDFDRLLTGELELAAESDRGAAQLLEQTRFLTLAFRAYEERLAEFGGADEHVARAQLIETPASQPLRHLVVSISDHPFDVDGFWPADVSLFTTMPGLETVDIVATAGVLDSGYLDRLRLAFVEIDEQDPVPAAVEPPTLVVPGQQFAFSYRDREDELEAVARRIKDDRRTATTGGVTPLDRIGLVVARPLPYLYLARDVFAGAGIPFEALDTLPLAAEPYAAAADLVLECAAANFTRRAITALLRSPHFTFDVDGAKLDRAAVSLLDVAMAEQRYLGGIDRLRAMTASWTGAERPAARAALTTAITLAP